jgi:hypothetical protein
VGEQTMSEPAKNPDAKRFFDELTTDYANNVAFESTVWDLKLIFGEYSDRDKSVEWHTSLTIPWAQAKLMQYYLQINIEIHERQHGQISVPNSMLPPEPSPPPNPNDPNMKAIYEAVREQRERFMQSLNLNQTQNNS